MIPSIFNCLFLLSIQFDLLPSKKNCLNEISCSWIYSCFSLFLDLDDSQPLLIDRIFMEFYGFSLYCAEQTSLFDPDLIRKSGTVKTVLEK